VFRGISEYKPFLVNLDFGVVIEWNRFWFECLCLRRRWGWCVGVGVWGSRSGDGSWINMSSIDQHSIRAQHD